MHIGYKILAILVVCSISFFTGMKVEGWRTDSKTVKAINKSSETAKVDLKKSEVIHEKKAEAEEKTKIIYRTIRQRIKDENDNRICFSNDSLQLWNAAIQGNTDSDRKELSGKTEEANTTEAEATAEQVLDNAADNFEDCNTNSIKHNALIDKVESIKDNMCYCVK